MKIDTREIVLFGALGSFISASQLILSFIPNVEIVSLLIILFSLIFRRKALYIVYTFVFIMGIIYGFGVWWFGYVMLWPLLCIITFTFSKFIEGEYFKLALYSGIFGVLFGFFYAIPYAVFGGLNAGIAYWISGLQFDIIHGISNYLIMQTFGERIFNLINKLNRNYLYAQ
ncbi:hypothetical protein [Clostridium sp.]|uniref:hypothetical protein n=1 Tax=Clostridium sp. TaxID=1506 RepID=UPI00262685C3|nr:hypothetical protein [Clostridium sp.]